ncbi:MAG TPA: hypothetical protein VGE07_30585, partial [Herpetosiphonaceae bacterium]
MDGRDAERMAAARAEMLAAIVAAAREDGRIAGLVEYGSGGEGRADPWSDLDLALFVRDGDLAAFRAGWKEWAAQFGRLLLAYVGGIGHPWTIYDTQPAPLRVDFAFHPESGVERILDWPNAPLSTASFVLHDATGGKLSAAAELLVGRSLAPADPAETFAQVSGDFWYYALRTWARLRRGDWWGAYADAQHILLGNLTALLRLEAGAIARWRASSAAAWLGGAINSERLAALERSLPAAGGADLAASILAMALLADEAGSA